ncbi:MAG TPA: ATP-binding protein, partial [Porphyromonadaceae bacterium]|nr:ATP-binding protein [Porphyromonadaceae bacterium]
CGEAGVSAVFPLWGKSTSGLMEQFITERFKTIVVSVRKEKLPKSFLGRLIDN